MFLFAVLFWGVGMAYATYITMNTEHRTNRETANVMGSVLFYDGFDFCGSPERVALTLSKRANREGESMKTLTKQRRKLREHAKKEIVMYARGSMNAKMSVAYAYTLQNGYLYSGEYMFTGETITFDTRDGYCLIGSENPVNLIKGENITF